MQGERFTGYSPDNLRWSSSGRELYFEWNPDMDTISPLYSILVNKPIPQEVRPEERKKMPSYNGTYNRDRSEMVYSKDGDLYLLQVNTGSIVQITNTSVVESNPEFSFSEDKILYTNGSNLYSWTIKNGSTEQLTDFRSGKAKPEEKSFDNERDKWLYDDQLRIFKVLDERKKVREISEKDEEVLKTKRPKTIYTGTDQVRSVSLSPDGNFITWLISTPVESQRTIIPEFVTETGYTEEDRSRSKVGTPPFSSSVLNIYDLKGDSVYKVITDDIPGISDQIEHAYKQPSKDPKKPEKRGVIMYGPYWSGNGLNAVVDIFSNDNKDRWIMLLDMASGGLKLLDRQHDVAWIGGPGIRYGSAPSWLPDNRRILFQSEETGYSHLYTSDIISGQKKALSSGKFEIYNPVLSKDKKYLYCLSNETDPGIRELYRISVQDGAKVKLTNFGGGVEAELSPDEKYFALKGIIV